MIGAIQEDTIKEGEVLIKWFDNRFNKRNQNIIVAVTGSTGSGKSYMCLRLMQLWYEYNFKEKFKPNIYVCFSISEAISLLSTGKLRKGDFIILEEAGVNLGALDFQSKVSKLFAYVLQSFRSMNVGLIMNLPVLTMLNKTARQLLHSHITTLSIDYQKKVCMVKPLFHQLNQTSGVSYWKYPKIKLNGKIVKVQRFNFKIPDAEIIKSYEFKKLRFLSDLTTDYKHEIFMNDRNLASAKFKPKELTPNQQQVFDYLQQGLSLVEIGARMGKCASSIHDIKVHIIKKGFNIKKETIDGVSSYKVMPVNALYSEIPIQTA